MRRLRAHRWPRLLVVVFATSVLLTLAAAAILAVAVGSSVRSAAVESAGSADQALAQTFANTELNAADLVATGIAPSEMQRVDQALAALKRGDSGLLRLKLHAPDGTILYSDDPTLRGERFAMTDDLAEALAGHRGTELFASGALGAEEQDLNRLGVPVIEEYVPIFGPAGAVVAAFEVYRDASPVVALADEAQRLVVIVLAVAAAVLCLLLWVVFRATQRRLDRQTDQLVEAARRDALTGLLNHGAIVGVLTDLLAGGPPEGGRPVGIALVDIDNFRLLNDTYSHTAGDFALLEVARVLRGELPQASALGRYGPDEFLAVAPPAAAGELEPAIARLRDRLAGASLQFGASERLPITVSAGISAFPEHGSTTSELLARATVALVEAKASGGDAIRVADRPADERRERDGFDVLQGLVIAVDTKDRYTKRHSEDVARYALFLADQLGLEPAFRRTLEVAGLLHDIGKIGIPDAILRKPGSLTADEYEIVKQHVALGDLVVRDVPDLAQVRAGVRHHHERWDGRGYLDRLAGEEIPLVARILAVGDAFSAMTTTRPYRKALSVEEALGRLLDAAGSQLDPELTTTFVRAMETSAAAPLPGVAGAPTPARLWLPSGGIG